MTIRHGRDDSAGGIVNNASTLTLENSTVSDNRGRFGGGINNFGGSSGATLILINSTVSDNVSAQGGGIGNHSGTVTLTDSIVSGNTATTADGQGGGILNSLGRLTLRNSTVSGNTATLGGGIDNTHPFAVATLENSSVSGNTATNGGGIYTAGPVTLTGSLVSGNTATNVGGGIDSRSSPGVTLRNSTVSDNTATDGGGIHLSGTGTANLLNSTISGNTATNVGGGIANQFVLVATNTTVSGNHAANAGGIHHNGNGVQTDLNNVTITTNTATSGGGGAVFNQGGFVGVRNTLLAGNVASLGPDCQGTLPSLGFNLVGDGTGCSGIAHGVNGDQVGTAASPIAALLGPLQDNGGLTDTHALLIGSPAIDNGNVNGCIGDPEGDMISSTLLTTDQRGFPRPAIPGGRCDIGAFEGEVEPPNAAPTAHAGADQTVPEGAQVTMDASGSSDPDHDPLSYQWTQLAGPLVTLDLTDPVHPTFVAPVVPIGGATLTFELSVSDGSLHSQDTVEITVKNVNRVPVADAGLDQTVGEGAPVTLHGENSYDPDGEPLSYAWVQTAGPTVSLAGANTAQATFTAPLVGAAGATLTFELSVSDGIASAPDTVTVFVENVNHAPTANAGADQTKAEGSLVMLDGSGSQDPDGDPLAFTWTQLSGPQVTLSGAETAMPTFIAPLVGPGGTTLVFELRVDDGLGGQATDAVSVLVQNSNDPPACEAARPSQPSLWPPNHKLIAVGIVGVTDPNNDPVTLTLTGVTQDEPLNGLGDGDTSPDAVLQGDRVLLRAERSGTGNGRVYQVHFTAEDSSGGRCTGAVAVCVPHD